MSARPIVTAIGEMLWDVYPDGARFGGAPANFACHAAALGAEAWLVSARGQDDAGDGALRELERHGVRADLVQTHATRPTGRVLVALDAAGQPRYEIAPEAAWDELVWNDDLAALAARCDAVCFGTLGQRSAASRAAIRRFLQATRPGALRILDVNLRQQYHDAVLLRQSMALANVVKLNDEELPVVARYCGCEGEGPEALRELASEHGLRCVALTRGPRSSLLLAGGAEHECTPPSTFAVDTVGAGDSFTAALALGLLRGQPLATIHRHASAVAAFVCSRKGVAPALPEHLLHGPADHQGATP